LSVKAFYEKVVKVKADVAAFLISCFPSAYSSGADAWKLSRASRRERSSDRRLVPIRFSRSCLRLPLLPGFYPHSQGATWARCTLGFDLKPGPCHHRDGARLVGCCHLFGDLRGSGHNPQSPEQGEWMSLLQTFPLTNRSPRHQSIFRSLGLSFRDCINFYGTLLGPAYAAVACLQING
jgi:hypothetical protein